MMAKERYINTKFWDDEYIVDLDSDGKLVFLYLLTNPLTTIAGIYEVSLKRIAFDTGLPCERVQAALKRFEEDGKVLFRNGWIAIKNFIRHQMSRGSWKVRKGIAIALRSVPATLREWVGGDGSLSVETQGDGKATDSVSNPMDSLRYPTLHLDPDSDPDSDPSSSLDTCVCSAPTAKAKRHDYPTEFEAWWAIYPRKVVKKAAAAKWKATLRKGVTAAELLTAARNYADDCERRGRELEYIKHPATFLGPAEPWRDWAEREPEPELTPEEAARQLLARDKERR